ADQSATEAECSEVAADQDLSIRLNHHGADGIIRAGIETVHNPPRKGDVRSGERGADHGDDV
ncbi:MAG: hypothetical protein O2960_30210, partial [Verrucomicrobia bacterium]|nr:hypothetical protein [Verrucomicrobiota bacterium]